MRSFHSSDVSPLDGIHDNRHKLPNSELARESLAFIIQIPEQGVGGFLYTWVNGQGLAGAAVCLFGDKIGAQPIFEVCDKIPVSDTMDFFDWRVGPLKLELLLPLETARVHYCSDELEVFYEFTANHPAYAYSTHNNGCPPWIATDRFEQQGYAKGFVKTPEQTIEYQSFSVRDHSWGTRDWAVNQHWKWVHAQAGDDIGIHFWNLFALGSDHLCGYVHKEGLLAQIVDVKTSFSCDEGLKPRSLEATVLDSAGRTSVLNATTYGRFPFQVHPLITLFECPLNLTIDGISGGGWMEIMWPNALIEVMKDRSIEAQRGNE